MDRKETGYKLTKLALALGAAGFGASISAVNPLLAAMIGGPSVELFAAIFASPMEKRRDRWIAELYGRLIVLEQSLEDLANNEVLISAFIQSSQVAMKTHQQEKLDALRNAVVNVALDIDIDESIQQWCISQIEFFTPTHIRLLVFLDNPEEFMRLRYPNLSATNAFSSEPEDIFPGLGNSVEFYNQVYQDLQSLGLLKLPNPKPTARERLTERQVEGDRQYFGKQVESGQMTSTEADEIQYRRSKQRMGADSQSRVNLHDLVKELLANPTQNLSTKLGHQLVRLIKFPDLDHDSP
jgi:hypothetical protein